MKITPDILTSYQPAGTPAVGFGDLLGVSKPHLRFLMLNWRDPKNPLAGGAERVTFRYMKEMIRRGHEVYWFAWNFPGAAREEIFEGIKIVRGGGFITAILKVIWWYRKQPRFDLVIDQHHGIPWFAPWWCGKDTNCIAYIHEVLGPIWDNPELIREALLPLWCKKIREEVRIHRLAKEEWKRTVDELNKLLKTPNGALRRADETDRKPES